MAQCFALEALRAQIAAILAGWGFDRAAVDATCDGLAYADLHGIDSHGIAMLPIYERWLAEGRFNRAAQPRVARETPSSALVDGDQAIGFLPARMAMRLAIDKARATGIAAIGVRRSNHFGAAGWYARMASDAGLIGLATTNTFAASVVPTFSREAMFGTNPIAFAAPTGDDQPFLLDMATSTVALGKLMTAANRGESIPVGWALDADGRPTTDPDVGYSARLATPLGGTPLLSSHKGYGLAAMVEILSATLTGALWPIERAQGLAGAQPDHGPAARPDPGSGARPDSRPVADERGDVGHFLLALDPGLFGERERFESRLAWMRERLRDCATDDPDDPERRVQIAGDPERAAAGRRRRDGVPLPARLLDALRAAADKAGAAWLLDEPARR